MHQHPRGRRRGSLFHDLGKPPSVHDGLGEDIDHDHARQDEAKADQSGSVEALRVKDEADERDQHDAKSTPDRISDTDRHRLDRDSEEIAGRKIADCCQVCRQ